MDTNDGNSNISNSRVIGGDEIALREFLAQYFNDSNRMIFIAQTPASEKIQVPIPKNARIIGSIVRENRSILTILSLALKPEQSIANYERELTEAGWAIVDEQKKRGLSDQGFIATS